MDDSADPPDPDSFQNEHVAMHPANGAHTMTTNPEIRAFKEADYEGIVTIDNAVYPDYVDTVDEWRYNDEHLDPRCHLERHVVEGPEGLVAFASAGHAAYSYDPKRLWVDFQVLTDHRGQGHGATLWQHLLRSIERFEPNKLTASAREDYASGRRFLEQRGFVETMREWENHLDAQAYDPTPFAGHVERVVESGIRLASLTELEGDDPDCYEKLYETSDAIGADVPSPDEHTKSDKATWIKKLKTNPNRMPDGFVVAVDGDRYVGVSTLWASQGEPLNVYTGLTGVRREYRRRGIALAMKLKALDYAKKNGHRTVKTWNATGNEGMLAINEALGFKKQPAWIEYALELGAE